MDTIRRRVCDWPSVCRECSRREPAWVILASTAREIARTNAQVEQLLDRLLDVTRRRLFEAGDHDLV